MHHARPSPLRLPDPAPPPGPTTDLTPIARAAQDGVEVASLVELLALVLSPRGSDGPRVRRRAERLVETFGNLPRLATATPGELAFRGRLSPARALRVAAAFGLGRRAAQRAPLRGTPLRTAADVADVCVERMRHLRHERFVTLLVDAKNRVLREDVVGEGGLSSVPVHPREAFGPAMREGASGVVFVHNHPSGDPEPSPIDDDLTRRLLAVGDLLGIRVLDHLVVGDGTWVSYRDRGIVPPA